MVYADLRSTCSYNSTYSQSLFGKNLRSWFNALISCTTNMKKNVALCIGTRFNESSILWYIIENPFPTLTEIARRKGYLTNTSQTKKYLEKLVKENIICRAHWWETLVYFVPEFVDHSKWKIMNFLRIKENSFSKLNQIKYTPEIQELASYYGIDDFTAIPKKVFSMKPMGYRLGLKKGKDPAIQIILKYIKIIFLETHIRIIEHNNSKRNPSKFHSSKKHLRETRLFNHYLKLKEFLESYSCNDIHYDNNYLQNLANDLDLEYRVLKKFSSDITHNAKHSSFNVRAMIEEKMGRKGEFSLKHRLKMDTITKIIKKFKHRGSTDLEFLSRYRMIEDATTYLNTNDIDISWLSYVDDARDELNRTRIIHDKKSEIEKEKVQKRVTRVFPKMRIF